MIFFSFFFQQKIISIHWSIVRVNRLSAIMWNGVFNYNMWNVVVIHGIVTLSFFPMWWNGPLQIAPDFFRRSFTPAIFNRGEINLGKNWGQDLEIYVCLVKLVLFKILKTTSRCCHLNENRGCKRKPGTESVLEKTTALRGIFCKQGWYSVVRHFQLTSIKGYFRFYIQMIVNPAKYMEPHLRTYNFHCTEIKQHLNSE